MNPVRVAEEEERDGPDEPADFSDDEVEDFPPVDDSVKIRVNAELVAMHTGDDDDHVKYTASAVGVSFEPGIVYELDGRREDAFRELRNRNRVIDSGRMYGLCASDVYGRLQQLGDWQ